MPKKKEKLKFVSTLNTNPSNTNVGVPVDKLKEGINKFKIGNSKMMIEYHNGVMTNFSIEAVKVIFFL